MQIFEDFDWEDYHVGSGAFGYYRECEGKDPGSFSFETHVKSLVLNVVHSVGQGGHSP